MVLLTECGLCSVHTFFCLNLLNYLFLVNTPLRITVFNDSILQILRGREERGPRGGEEREGGRGRRGIQRWNLLFEAKWIVNQCLLDILLVRYCSLPLENIKLNPVQHELIDSSIEDKNFKSKHRHKLVFYFTSNFTIQLFQILTRNSLFFTSWSVRS